MLISTTLCYSFSAELLKYFRGNKRWLHRSPRLLHFTHFSYCFPSPPSDYMFTFMHHKKLLWRQNTGLIQTGSIADITDHKSTARRVTNNSMVSKNEFRGIHLHINFDIAVECTDPTACPSGMPSDIACTLSNHHFSTILCHTNRVATWPVLLLAHPGLLLYFLGTEKTDESRQKPHIKVCNEQKHQT